MRLSWVAEWVVGWLEKVEVELRLSLAIQYFIVKLQILVRVDVVLLFPLLVVTNN